MQQKSGEKGKDCKKVGNPVKTVVKVSGQSQQMEKQSRLQKVAGKCQKQSPFVKDALNQGELRLLRSVSLSYEENGDLPILLFVTRSHL